MTELNADTREAPVPGPQLDPSNPASMSPLPINPALYGKPQFGNAGAPIPGQNAGGGGSAATGQTWGTPAITRGRRGGARAPAVAGSLPAPSSADLFAPTGPPFQWEDVAAEPEYQAADPIGKSQVKGAYYDSYVKPTGKTYSQWSYDVGPSLPGRIWGTVRGKIGAYGLSAAELADHWGMPNVANWMREGYEKDVQAGEEAAIPLEDYGPGLLGQARALATGRGAEKMAIEGTLGMADYWAALGVGGAAGAGVGGLGGPAAPVTVPVGAFIGGMLAVAGTSWAEEYGKSKRDFLLARPGDVEGAKRYAQDQSNLSAAFAAMFAGVGHLIGGAGAKAAKAYFENWLDGLTSEQALQVARAAQHATRGQLKTIGTDIAAQAGVATGQTMASNKLARESGLAPDRQWDDGLVSQVLMQSIFRPELWPHVKSAFTRGVDRYRRNPEPPGVAGRPAPEAPPLPQEGPPPAPGAPGGGDGAPTPEPAPMEGAGGRPHPAAVPIQEEPHGPMAGQVQDGENPPAPGVAAGPAPGEEEAGLPGSQVGPAAPADVSVAMGPTGSAGQPEGAPGAEQAGQAPQAPGGQSSGQVAPTFVQHLKGLIDAGQMPRNNRDLEKAYVAYSDLDPKSITPSDKKMAQEDMESALAMHARDLIQTTHAAIAADPQHPGAAAPHKHVFDLLRNLYGDQPNLDYKSGTQQELNAYSTPLPLGYIADILGRVDRNSEIYEPTAGNGMLVLTGDPKNTLANEIDPARARRLKEQGFNVLEHDARDAVASGVVGQAVGDKKADVVLMNPPFGGEPEFRHEGYRMNHLEHRIAIDALSAMKDEGRAVIIMGANPEVGVRLEERPFFNWLWNNHRVVGHFEINGKLYSRQGAGWPIRIIAIDGRLPNNGNFYPAPEKQDVKRAKTWDEAYELAKSIYLKEGAPGGSTEPVVETPDAGPGSGGAGGAPVTPGPAAPGTGGMAEPVDLAGGEPGAGSAEGQGARAATPQRRQTATATPERPGAVAGGVGVKPVGGERPGAGELATREGKAGRGAEARPVVEPENEGVRPGGAGQRPVKEPGIPAFITQSNKAKLKRFGFTDAEIAKMKPDVALDTIRSREEEEARGPEPMSDIPMEEANAGERVPENGKPVSKPGGKPTASEGAGATAGKRKAAAEQPGNLQGLEPGAAKEGGEGLPVGPEAREPAAEPEEGAAEEPAIGAETVTGLHDAAPLADSSSEDGSVSMPRQVRTEVMDARGLQAKYQPASHQAADEALVPTNLANPLHDSMAKLEEEVGPIDAFLRKKLGYGKGEMGPDVLNGVQADGVALAIHQIEKGGALIIGDSTGVGKGQQGAALIRYATRNGYLPVYMTEKKALFSDVYRDLLAVGSGELQPLILNSDGQIFDKNGQVVHEPSTPAQLRAMASDIASGRLPAGKDFLIGTYSQFNRPNWKQQMLTGMVSKNPKVLLLLDEAHNAAGDSQQGQFFGSVLDKAASAVYLSATYAKRPDNMGLYARTDMLKAFGKMSQLVDAVRAGGLTLQEVISRNLATVGQIVRREKSFEGVSLRTEVGTASKARDEKTSDTVTAALRAIRKADELFSAELVRPLQRDLHEANKDREEGASPVPVTVSTRRGDTPAYTIGHAGFGSQTHNAIKQLLYAIKADQIADHAIAAVKAGEKPIIAVENTMGSVIEALSGELKHGDVVRYSYKDILKRMLKNAFRISHTDQFGDKKATLFKYDELPPQTKQAYDAALQVVDKVDVDAPISPIDHIYSRLEAAGVSVGEITGRARRLIYQPDGSAVVHDRNAEEMNRVKAAQRFNSGDLNALVLNVAGASGISLHASKTFKNQQVRHMLIGQPAADVNVFVQMLGRVHRTGQVQPPKYTLLAADIPAERRPAALLAKKLKSLNANTTSNTKSATDVDSPDMLNQYGDDIMWDHLIEHPEVVKDLGIGIFDDHGDPDREKKPEIARKATGYAALLPVTEQRQLYDQIEPRYNDYVQYLTETGQNRLEARTLDYDAKTLSRSVAIAGEGEEGNPFTADTHLEALDIKRQGKPPTAEEVQAAIDKVLEGKDPDEYFDKVLGPSQEAFKRYQQAKAELGEDVSIPDRVRFLSRELPVGHAIDLEIEGEELQGVVTRYTTSWKPGHKGNPLAPSNIGVEFMVDGPLRKVKIPLTMLDQVMRGNSFKPTLRLLFDKPVPQRQQVRMLTGNLLSGFSLLQSAGVNHPEIINFRTHEGEIRQGVHVPPKIDLAAARAGMTLESGDKAMDFLSHSVPGRELEVHAQGPGGVPSLLVSRRRDGGYVMRIPTAKAIGGRWIRDPQFKQWFGEFFWKKGERFLVVPLTEPAMARKVLDHVAETAGLAGEGGMDAMNSAREAMRGPAVSRETPESRAAPGIPQDVRPEVMRERAREYFGAAAPEVEIVDRLFSSATGQAISGRYHRGILEIAKWAADPVGTLDHESFHHFLEEVAPDDVRATLRALFAPRRPANEHIARLLEARGESSAAPHARASWQEAASYAFENFARDNYESPSKIAQTTLGRVRNMLGRVWRFVSGFGARPEEKVFRDVMQGRYRDQFGRAEGSRGVLESRASTLFGSVVRDIKEQPEAAPEKWTDKILKLGFDVLPVHKALGFGVDALAPLVPERIKAGLVNLYGVGEKARYQEAVAAHERNVNRGYRRATALTRSIGDLTPQESAIAYEWMNTKPDAAREAELMADLPEHSRESLQTIKQVIHDLGAEAVKLKLVSQDSFDRNAFAYLHRMYRQYELNPNGSLPFSRRLARRVIGDELKGRGMPTDWIDRLRVNRDASDQWRHDNPVNQPIVGQKFLRFNLKTDDGRNLNHIYWPEDHELPARLTQGRWQMDAGADGPNLWESRWADRGQVGMWRDYSPAERQVNGEITEVKYAVARTFQKMVRDIETARHLRWIATHGDLGGAVPWVVSSPEDIPEGHSLAEAHGAAWGLLRAYKPHEWVQVPETKIAKTPGVLRYGALAGKYVHGPVWNDIRQVAGWDQKPFGQFYDKALRVFKLAKTAYTPATHVNMTVQNFFLADAADVGARDVLRSLHLIFGHLRGDPEARKQFQEIEDSGALGASYAGVELQKEVIEPLRAELRQQQRELDEAPEDARDTSRSLILAESAWHAIKKAGAVPTDLYHWHNNLFRIASYLKGKDMGLTDAQAAHKAMDDFLDYRTNAPWVNLAAQTALPFIRYTAAAMPKMLQIAREKPWKLMKWWLLAGALNGVGYALSGGNEERERALLPPEKAGNVLGIFPRLLRMPWNGPGTSPVFDDIQRFLPGGDWADLGQSHSAIPIPPFVTPGGPLQLAAEILSNEAFYTGKPIVAPTDTTPEHVRDVMLHIWRAMAPNFVLWPRSYNWDNVGLPGSDRNRLDPFGREYPQTLAWANTLGIKLAAYPEDTAQLTVLQDLNRKVKALEGVIAVAGYRYGRGGMDFDQFKDRQKEIVERIRAEVEKANARLNKGKAA